MDRPANNVKAIFIAALDHEPGADRAAYLDAACGDDAELRRRVEALLARPRASGRSLGPRGGANGRSGRDRFERESPRSPKRRAGESPQHEFSSSAASITAEYQEPAGTDVLIAGRYMLATEDRRRRHGRGLGRQADRAGQTQGRAEADQDRHGFQGGAGAVRAGAAGPGDDGPSQYRPRARRRPDARPASRSSSWSWSTACR